jgi:ribA/ribD-fused uncharacterized protein
MTEPITAFRGRWTKLGNYSSCVVFYEGHAYPSTEHAYQAAKFLPDFPEIAAEVRHAATAGASKHRANASKPLWREDWHQIKPAVMVSLLREKFSQEPERSILLSTGSADLIEGNWWHDNFWGDCRCGRESCAATGENMLGKSLVLVRDELRVGTVVTPSTTYAPKE